MTGLQFTPGGHGFGRGASVQAGTLTIRDGFTTGTVLRRPCWFNAGRAFTHPWRVPSSLDVINLPESGPRRAGLYRHVAGVKTTASLAGLSRSLPRITARANCLRHRERANPSEQPEHLTLVDYIMDRSGDSPLTPLINL